jgi:hypothetical protein
MDILEQFLHNISYKFPKGYPDMGDPKDVELLHKLINENNSTSHKSSILENTEEDIYDSTIRKALGLDNNESIPEAKGNYKLENNTFEFSVSSQDKSTFDKLFNVAPPKKGEEEGETKGVGNGEVALYWLYKFSDSNIKVTVGRSGDDPDLFFNGNVGVEVKAYSRHTGKIGLGRYGADRENINLLSVAFGIKALSEVLGSKKEGPAINPTNFKGSDLTAAFEQVIELEKIPDLDRLASQYNVFDTIKKNIDILNNALNSPTDAKDAALSMAYKMVESKLGRKPGSGGYLANVLKNGSIKFFKIDLSKLETNEDLLDNIAAKQSALYLDFEKMFG